MGYSTQSVCRRNLELPLGDILARGSVVIALFCLLYELAIVCSTILIHFEIFLSYLVLLHFSLTVKAAPHECVLGLVNFRHRYKLKRRRGFI